MARKYTKYTHRATPMGPQVSQSHTAYSDTNEPALMGTHTANVLGDKGATGLIQGSQQRTTSKGLAVEDKSRPSSTVSSSHLAREPMVGKIYYLPQQEDIHNASVIHKQKQEKHFFGHPIIVIGVEEDIAFFNCATTSRANAIRDLNMGLLVGTTPTNQGRMALRLNEGSSTFSRETWINLDQRYHIEWYNLREWDNDIRVRPDEIRDKLETRVRELEADQIRYIYKPLPRDLSSLRPGTVIMLLNSPKSKTVGAPVLIVAQHSQCHYLRIKEFKGNKYFNPNAEGTKAQVRELCLAITKHSVVGHDNTPVMVLESDSPEPRSPSYVEVLPNAAVCNLRGCKTWCWPPIVITQASMEILRQHMDLLASVEALKPIRPQPSSASSVPPTPNQRSPMYPQFPPSSVLPTPYPGSPIHPPYSIATLAPPASQPWSPIREMFPIPSSNAYNTPGTMLPPPFPLQPGSQHAPSIYTPLAPHQVQYNGYNTGSQMQHGAAQAWYPPDVQTYFNDHNMGGQVLHGAAPITYSVQQQFGFNTCGNMPQNTTQIPHSPGVQAPFNNHHMYSYIPHSTTHQQVPCYTPPTGICHNNANDNTLYDEYGRPYLWGNPPYPQG